MSDDELFAEIRRLFRELEARGCKAGANVLDGEDYGIQSIGEADLAFATKEEMLPFYVPSLTAGAERYAERYLTPEWVLSLWEEDDEDRPTRGEVEHWLKSQEAYITFCLQEETVEPIRRLWRDRDA